MTAAQAGAAALARGLSLAAAPTFLAMAALAGAASPPMDAFCSGAHGLGLGGMGPMYLLMSAFHAPAWLKLLPGR